jgi:hypothetical protein
MSEAILKQLALRILKAQSLGPLEQSKETEAAEKEARQHNISPNQMLGYAFQHRVTLEKAIESEKENIKFQTSSFKNANSLSAFTAVWEKENPSRQANSPEFLSALNSHVKRFVNFNYYG